MADYEEQLQFEGSLNDFSERLERVFTAFGNAIGPANRQHGQYNLLKSQPQKKAYDKGAFVVRTGAQHRNGRLYLEAHGEEKDGEKSVGHVLVIGDGDVEFDEIVQMLDSTA